MTDLRPDVSVRFQFEEQNNANGYLKLLLVLFEMLKACSLTQSQLVPPSSQKRSRCSDSLALLRSHDLFH